MDLFGRKERVEREERRLRQAEIAKEKRAAADLASYESAQRELQAEFYRAMRSPVANWATTAPAPGTRPESAAEALVELLEPMDRAELRTPIVRAAKKLLTPDDWILGVGGLVRWTRDHPYGPRPQQFTIITDRGFVVAQGSAQAKLLPPQDVFLFIHPYRQSPAGWSVSINLTAGAFQMSNSDLGHTHQLVLSSLLFTMLRDGRAQRPDPTPSPTLDIPGHLIRSPRDAEEAAASTMRRLGFADAALTASGADEGKDVDSLRAVAQVKAEMVPTGRPVIQQLFGVAAAEGKRPICFSLAGYTQQAKDWASQHGVALFRFDLQGAAQPENGIAIALGAEAEQSRVAHSAVSNAEESAPQSGRLTPGQTVTVMGMGAGVVLQVAGRLVKVRFPNGMRVVSIEQCTARSPQDP